MPLQENSASTCTLERAEWGLIFNRISMYFWHMVVLYAAETLSWPRNWNLMWELLRILTTCFVGKEVSHRLLNNGRARKGMSDNRSLQHQRAGACFADEIVTENDRLIKNADLIIIHLTKMRKIGHGRFVPIAQRNRKGCHITWTYLRLWRWYSYGSFWLLMLCIPDASWDAYNIPTSAGYSASVVNTCMPLSDQYQLILSLSSPITHSHLIQNAFWPSTSNAEAVGLQHCSSSSCHAIGRFQPHLWFQRLGIIANVSADSPMHNIGATATASASEAPSADTNANGPVPWELPAMADAELPSPVAVAVAVLVAPGPVADALAVEELPAVAMTALSPPEPGLSTSGSSTTFSTQNHLLILNADVTSVVASKTLIITNQTSQGFKMLQKHVFLLPEQQKDSCCAIQ